MIETCGGSGSDLAINRHAQKVGAEADHRVEGLQAAAHGFLVAREWPEIGWVLARKMRPLQHRLVIDRAAQHLCKLRRLGERVAPHDFITSDNHRPLRIQQPQGEGTQALIRWAHARVDPRRLPKIDRAERVQDVARQGDKHRSGRRCRSHLGGAVNDPRQVFEPCDLGRPLHDRCGDRHQRGIQQRLGQPMSLLLLSSRHDERSAGIESRKQ